jgi:TonB family protein
MMKLWFDSYARSTTLTPSAALSVVAHAVVIGAAIAATAESTTETRQLPETSIVAFLAPPDRASGQRPQQEMVRYVAISVPDISTAVRQQSITKLKPVDELPGGKDEHNAPALPELHGEDSVFSVVEVDSVATRYEWSAAPAYPPKMLEQKTEGYVRAEFIVSAEGFADTTTVRIVATTHEDFTKAVLDALPFMRFKPAKIGHQTVNQLVLQEFRFQITTASVDTTKVRKPIP